MGADDTLSDPVLAPRPKRIRHPNSRLKDFVRSVYSLNKGMTRIPIPRSLKEARFGPDAKQRETAVSTEYNALIYNKTWNSLYLPPGRKALGCQWLFDVMYNADETIDQYEARLVVLGNTQQYVARYELLRLLLAVSTILDYHIHPMDVSTAFLNGDLTEEICMRQPQGFRHGSLDTV